MGRQITVVPSCYKIINTSLRSYITFCVKYDSEVKVIKVVLLILNLSGKQSCREISEEYNVS